MEFPHLGQNCNEDTCHRLDFLPMKCDSCNKVYCSTHFHYERHNCIGGNRKNIQVPVCPLCGEPVPTAPGVEPDLTVGQHIDQQCKSDTKKIFTNRCNQKGCKRKELIPVTCSLCKHNFCLRHRHSADHDCQASKMTSTSGNGNLLRNMSEADQRTLTANAAEYRRTNKPTSLFNANPKPNVATATTARSAAIQRNASSNQLQNMQGNMTEDEALARALALSIIEMDETADRNRRNEAAASSRRVPVGGRDGQQTNGKDKCSLS